jgi:hypothetical protein
VERGVSYNPLAGTEDNENPGQVRRTGPESETGGPEYELQSIAIQSRGSLKGGFWNFVSENERSQVLNQYARWIASLESL